MAPVRLLCAERLKQEVYNARCVLDVGSGGRRLAPHVVATDIVARAGVDVVADACGGLPFPDESFDLAVCTSVLEHVMDDRAALSEIVRVTRKGGRVWLEVPFLYHFHVSSAGDIHDFCRWTWEGCKRLLPSCRVLEHGHNVGPGTALRLMAGEVLAQPFHHEHHEGAYYLVRWMLGWLLWPLSWLDGLCARKAIAHRATGGFWLLAERV
jgi:SAM-dependent methyltransferase